jgi:hypothetical protein
MKKSSNPQFTVEQEVILWSIRVDHMKDQRIAEILEQGVDWTYIRQTGIQHGIIPLLYRRLNKEMAVLVPPDEMKKLRILFLENAAKNLRMTKELLRVLDLLADAGIEAMPFKGPALAMQAYGDLSMRNFCDLDILIHKSDFDRVYKILLNNNFTPAITVDAEIKKKFILRQKEFYFSGHGIHLDMHWKLTDRFFIINLDFEKFWNQNKLISLNASNVRTLNLEDVLILICIYGSLNFWHDLKWISDLTYLIKNHPNFEWNGLVRQADEMGIRRMVILGLFLAQECGGINYPSGIKNLFSSDLIFQNLINKIKNNFFLQKKPPLTLLINYMRLRERIQDRVTDWVSLLSYEIFIPNYYDFNFIPLPLPLFPLYFIIRPFRLIKEHFPNSIQKPFR